MTFKILDFFCEENCIIFFCKFGCKLCKLVIEIFYKNFNHSPVLGEKKQQIHKNYLNILRSSQSKVKQGKLHQDL